MLKKNLVWRDVSFLYTCGRDGYGRQEGLLIETKERREWHLCTIDLKVETLGMIRETTIACRLLATKADNAVKDREIVIECCEVQRWLEKSLLEELIVPFIFSFYIWPLIQRELETVPHTCGHAGDYYFIVVLVLQTFTSTNAIRHKLQ